VRALVIPADQDEPARVEELTGPASERMRALQALVGGFFQAIGITVRGSAATLWMDEEGKLKDPMAPLNRRAHRLAQSVLMRGDWVGGDAVVMGPPSSSGNETDCPQAVIDLAREWRWLP